MSKANDRQVDGDHYKAPNGIEHWDIVLANDIPYMEAQIIRYVMRWRRKNGLKDLQKAQHFLEKLQEWAEDNPQKWQRSQDYKIPTEVCRVDDTGANRKVQTSESDVGRISDMVTGD